jgi:hypothetical protein
MAQEDRVEIIGKQNTLFGEAINLVQFKNLKEKREVKEKVKAMFNGQMIRSILTPRDEDMNKRLDKIERQQQSGDRSTAENTMERADSFGKKTLNTLSTFPSLITFAYTTLLSEEGDLVLDSFSGHNSRASDVLGCGRKYVGFDVHTFPLDFIRKHCESFPKEDYTLHQQSSESVPYPDNHFDFSITCPPYADVEKYEKIYGESRADDLSGFTYEQFIKIYSKCLNEVYRTLKPNKYFVLVIGNVHREGKCIDLRSDTIKICKKAGFILHDENIYNRKSNIGGDLNYKTFILTCKRFPTIHEYILIFKKPDSSKKKTEFKLKSKEELTAILQACLLLYEGVPSYKVEEDVGKSFTGIARFMLEKLKNEPK